MLAVQVRVSTETFLVTGALGCIGAWTVRALLEADANVVALDLDGDDERLRLVLSKWQLATLARAAADIADLDALERILDEHAVTNVIHLAALQVPFCKAAPPLGARVNVVGTVNVFEAVKRRRPLIENVVYASSAAIYGGGHWSGRAPEDVLARPETHYGVYKLANEGTARIYWQDDGLPSVGLRPYVVYGPGRDQGLTSTPTQAMRAAARGEGFEISFGGRSVFNYAPDVAAAFVQASRNWQKGARVFNLPGSCVTMEEVVAAIELAAPAAAGRISFDDIPLPFPEELEADSIVGALGSVPSTPLAQGIRQTIEHFRQ